MFEFDVVYDSDIEVVIETVKDEELMSFTPTETEIVSVKEKPLVY